jgi:hypothetical protein
MVGLLEMRTRFGTLFSRFLRGGVVLSALESWALQTLIASLPPELRQIVEAQFQRYVLAQREVDGRALNFYPRRSEMRAGLSAPLLKMKVEEAPLVRIKFSVPGHGRHLHAVLTAVSGRAFCVSFSNDVRPFAVTSGFELANVEQSWRSNFHLAKESAMTSESDDKQLEKRSHAGAGIAIGIAVGVAIGTALDQLALGIALGVAFGVAIGAASRARHKKD